LEPDLIIYLDLTPEEVARRKEIEPNVLDSRPLDFHRRVAQTYAKMAQSDPDRWHTFNATQPPEVLANMIRDLVIHRLYGDPSAAPA
jgi:thymidylate kinase